MTGSTGSPRRPCSLTPSHDELIGEEAAAVMREGIPNATEVAIPRTGHMFRFTHPVTYARAIRDFLTVQPNTCAVTAALSK